MYQLLQVLIARKQITSIFVLLLSISSAFTANAPAASKKRGISPSSCCQRFQRFCSDLQSYTRDNCAILRQVIKHPAQVAAFSASSPWLVRKMLQPLANTSKDTSLKILEIGFGTGTVTDQIIPLMGPSDRLDAVELNEAWCTQVQARYPTQHYENVRFYAEDFEKWQSPIEDPYDMIICTLPFTRLPTLFIRPCLEKINTLLKPGGTFIYITLVGARTCGKIASTCNKTSTEYATKMALLDHWSTTNFSHHTRSTELFNVTPAFVHYLTKKAE